MRSMAFPTFRTGLLQISAKTNPFKWNDSTSARCLSTQLYPLCAGHSKWSNIKHIKAEKDGQKAGLFAKLSRQIRLAVQDGGSADPALNSQLKSVIEVALRQNMPMATIQNNLKKFTASKTQLKKYRLDVRFKQKVFAVLSIYTDNFAQLKMELATVLRKGGAVLIDASNFFEDYGLIQATLPKELLTANLEDKITEDAIESGADDVEVVDPKDGAINFICNPEIITGVQKLLENKGYLVDNTEHIYNALNTVTLTPEEIVEYENFVKKLKGISGIEEVYDNIEMAQV